MRPKFISAEKLTRTLARAVASSTPLDVGGAAYTVKFLTSPTRASIHFRGAGKIEISIGEIIASVAEQHGKPAHRVIPVMNDDKTLKGLTVR